MDEDDNDETNPLLHPCVCKGHSANIHFKCLKQWLESNITKKLSNNTFYYKWKKL